jgi:hypothetical protein
MRSAEVKLIRNIKFPKVRHINYLLSAELKHTHTFLRQTRFWSTWLTQFVQKQATSTIISILQHREEILCKDFLAFQRRFVAEILLMLGLKLVDFDHLQMKFV